MGSDRQKLVGKGRGSFWSGVGEGVAVPEGAASGDATGARGDSGARRRQPGRAREVEEALERARLRLLPPPLRVERVELGGSGESGGGGAGGRAVLDVLLCPLPNPALGAVRSPPSPAPHPFPASGLVLGTRWRARKQGKTGSGPGDELAFPPWMFWSYSP